MDFILAAFFREHHQHEAWWYLIKITPKVDSHSTNYAMLPTDEAPGEYCLSKLLGITMIELWKVLSECNLTRKKGQKHIIMQDKIEDFIALHSLTDVLAVNTKKKQVVLRIGVYSSTTSASTDDNPTSQWQSEKRPPRPLRDEAKKFRDDMKEFFNEASSPAESSPAESSPAESSPAESSPPSG